MHNVGDHDHCCLYYIGNTNDEKIIPKESEIINYKYYSLEELNNPEIPPEIKDRVKRAFETYNKIKGKQSGMKIFIASSKHLYHKIPEIKNKLESMGHIVTLPNSYDEPFKEEEMKQLSPEEHTKWKAEMMRRDVINIQPNDAILVLNFEKKGQPNYIGGATFLEIYKAWDLRKKIFLYNPIPDNMFKDELIGINPLIINGNLELIK